MQKKFRHELVKFYGKFGKVLPKKVVNFAGKKRDNLPTLPESAIFRKTLPWNLPLFIMQRPGKIYHFFGKTGHKSG